LKEFMTKNEVGGGDRSDAYTIGTL
jgi:hypothetical protein